MPYFEQKQLDFLRELAQKVLVLALSPENEAVKKRWRDVNALRKPDRAPVWCKPVGAMGEFLPPESFVCTDPFLRGIEYSLRVDLLKAQIGDDTPFNPYFPVSVQLDVTPQNIWGLDVAKKVTGDKGGSWMYDSPLKSEEDYDKLVLPQFEVNHVRTQEVLEKTQEALGDILPVKQVCQVPLSATMGVVAAELRGLEQIMLDMALEPHLMHRLMGHIQKGILKVMDELEKTGLLTPNNDGPMILSDPLGGTDGPFTLKDQWVMANSQEFDQVSPAMWEEFCLQYQKPIIERFGLSAYGCCENLTHKVGGVLSIENLRIFVCSAWSDLQKIVDAVGDKKVIMWRQKASQVVFASSNEELRAPLEQGMKTLKGCFSQIVMRELETMNGHMDRLHIWTRYAKEAAEKYS